MDAHDRASRIIAEIAHSPRRDCRRDLEVRFNCEESHLDGGQVSSYLLGIAAAAERINAKSFTIDGEAVVLGPDGLSRFDELRRQAAARTAVLYAFDLIEHDGEDPGRARSGLRSGILRESRCSGSAARSGTGEAGGP
jgi:hypothetical protein